MGHRTNRRLLAAGATGLALWGANLPVARAQEDAASEAIAVDSILLDPIIVTARRREEAVQDAPVSLTVVPAEKIGIDDVDDLEDAAFRSPNVLFNAQGGPLTIRGVGSLGLAGGVDRQPSVGVFLDEVYLARPNGYSPFLQDIERVELVRGSQATLYGRNTIGGAVNLVSRAPGAAPSAELTTSVGSGPQGRVSAAFDAPLGGGGFATRGYGVWSGRKGYIRNRPTDEDVSDADVFAGRSVTAGTLGEATDLKVVLDYSRDRSDGGLWYAPLPLAFDFRSDHDFEPDYRQDIGGASVRIDHRFDAATLTSISAVRGYDFRSVLDGDFTPTPYIGQAQIERQRQISQDLRLTSDDQGPWRWTGGLFHMHEDFRGDQFFDLASLPFSLWSRDEFEQRTDTWSAFGEVGYDVTERFQLVGGLRYTYETKDTVSEISTPSGTFFFGTPGYAEAQTSFDNWSPEVSAIYRLREGVLAYAKYSRGFKAGGASPYIEGSGAANVYDPELTDTYEIGAKTTWLDGQLTLNGALFYVDWTDQQGVIYTSPFTRIIRNAAASTSKGLEVEAAYSLTDEVRLSAAYGFTDARYDEFVDDVLGVDYSGNALPYAPEHSVILGLGWEREMENGVRLSAGADYSYRSAYAFTSDNAYRQAPTHLLDTRIGVARDNWTATLWARNLTNARYLRQYFSYSGTDMGVAAEGRAVGLTVSARW